jgi:pimeloyl-ACP methyl ester carboxylesterase
MRFYAENFGKESMADAFCRNPTKVPAAVMDAAHEITHTPESVVRHKYHNLISFTTLDVGGHFLAFEEPQLLADDFLKFAARVETILSKKADKKKSEL